MIESLIELQGSAQQEERVLNKAFKGKCENLHADLAQNIRVVNIIAQINTKQFALFCGAITYVIVSEFNVFILWAISVNNQNRMYYRIFTPAHCFHAPNRIIYICERSVMYFASFSISMMQTHWFKYNYHLFLGFACFTFLETDFMNFLCQQWKSSLFHPSYLKKCRFL